MVVRWRCAWCGLAVEGETLKAACEALDEHVGGCAVRLAGFAPGAFEGVVH
jgi:hypothetical protein